MKKYVVIFKTENSKELYGCDSWGEATELAKVNGDAAKAYVVGSEAYFDRMTNIYKEQFGL